MDIKHMNQAQLSRRLGISPRTLEGWRRTGAGQNYLKFGTRVVYRIEDIEKFELDNQRLHKRRVTPKPLSMPTEVPQS